MKNIIDDLSKKERTHNLIIEKAAELFNEQGYAGTAISDIMKATGLKKGGIYSHFKNKKDIAFAAFEYLANKLFFSFKDATLENRTAIEKLDTLLEIQKDLYNKDFLSGGCPLLNTATEADDTEPEMLKLVKKYVERWRKTISQIINEGISKNEIRASINADKFAASYIAIIEGGNFMAKVYNDSSYRLDAINQLKKIIKHELKE